MRGYRTAGILHQLPGSADSLRRLDGTEQHAQTQIHQIDVGDREGDVAGEHNTFVEDAIEQLEERDLAMKVVFRRR